MHGLPPDYSQFSIEEIELIYERFRAAILVTTHALCAVQFKEPTPGRTRPGLQFLEERLIGSLSDDLAMMVEFLRAARFPNAAQRDRAQRLILRYELDQGLDIYENITTQADRAA